MSFEVVSTGVINIQSYFKNKIFDQKLSVFSPFNYLDWIVHFSDLLPGFCCCETWFEPLHRGNRLMAVLPGHGAGRVTKADSNRPATSRLHVKLLNHCATTALKIQPSSEKFTCAFGEIFYSNPTMNSKKGGFLSIRCDSVRNFETNLLNKWCSNWANITIMR